MAVYEGKGGVGPGSAERGSQGASNLAAASISENTRLAYQGALAIPVDARPLRQGPVGRPWGRRQASVWEIVGGRLVPVEPHLLPRP